MAGPHGHGKAQTGTASAQAYSNCVLGDSLKLYVLKCTASLSFAPHNYLKCIVLRYLDSIRPPGAVTSSIYDRTVKITTKTR